MAMKMSLCLDIGSLAGLVALGCWWPWAASGTAWGSLETSQRARPPGGGTPVPPPAIPQPSPRTQQSRTETLLLCAFSPKTLKLHGAREKLCAAEAAGGGVCLRCSESARSEQSA